MKDVLKDHRVICEEPVTSSLGKAPDSRTRRANPTASAIGADCIIPRLLSGLHVGSGVLYLLHVAHTSCTAKGVFVVFMPIHDLMQMLMLCVCLLNRAESRGRIICACCLHTGAHSGHARFECSRGLRYRATHPRSVHTTSGKRCSIGQGRLAALLVCLWPLLCVIMESVADACCAAQRKRLWSSQAGAITASASAIKQ